MTNISITFFFGDLELSRNVFTKKVIDPDSKVYTDEEVQLICGYLRKQAFDLRTLGLLLCFETGMRIGELSALKPEDIDLDGDRIHVCRTEIKSKMDDGKWHTFVQDMPKTESGNRYVMINDQTKMTLKCILNQQKGEYLFHNENGARIHSHGFRRKLMRVCKKLDVTYKSPHCIRRTYASVLLDNPDVHDATVMRQLGHSDIATTRNYYYYAHGDAKKQLAEIKKAINI